MEMNRTTKSTKGPINYLNKPIEHLKGKQHYHISKSPTKKFIEEHFHDLSEEFNINKILTWDQYNTRLYSMYVQKEFEAADVMMNIMTMDKQIQNLEDNYRIVRKIRDDEKMFNEMLSYLKRNFVLISN